MSEDLPYLDPEVAVTVDDPVTSDETEGLKPRRPAPGRVVDDGDVDEFDFADNEPEALGRLVSGGEGDLSAEEAAVHIVEP
jgi:hypothetical protein